MDFLKISLFVFSLCIFTDVRAEAGSFLSESSLGVHEETALVAFYGALFIRDHDPLSFYNSEDSEERIFFTDLLDRAKSLSTGSEIRRAMESSLKSLLSSPISPGNDLIQFEVPGGKVYYECHSHTHVLKSPENHCSACRRGNSISVMIVTEEIQYQIIRRCPF